MLYPQHTGNRRKIQFCPACELFWHKFLDRIVLPI